MASSAGWTAFRAWASSLVVALSACASPRASEHAEGQPEAHTATAAETRLPYYSTPDFTAEWHDPGSQAALSAHTIAAFSFVDQFSRPVSRESLRGKIYVANFFFTSCP